MSRQSAHEIGKVDVPNNDIKKRQRYKTTKIIILRYGKTCVINSKNYWGSWR